MRTEDLLACVQISELHWEAHNVLQNLIHLVMRGNH